MNEREQGGYDALVSGALVIATSAQGIPVENDVYQTAMSAAGLLRTMAASLQSGHSVNDVMKAAANHSELYSL